MPRCFRFPYPSGYWINNLKVAYNPKRLRAEAVEQTDYFLEEVQRSSERGIEYSTAMHRNYTGAVGEVVVCHLLNHERFENIAATRTKDLDRPDIVFEPNCRHAWPGKRAIGIDVKTVPIMYRHAEPRLTLLVKRSIHEKRKAENHNYYAFVLLRKRSDGPSQSFDEITRHAKQKADCDVLLIARDDVSDWEIGTGWAHANYQMNIGEARHVYPPYWAWEKVRSLRHANV